MRLRLPLSIGWRARIIAGRFRCSCVLPHGTRSGGSMSGSIRPITSMWTCAWRCAGSATSSCVSRNRKFIIIATQAVVSSFAASPPDEIGSCSLKNGQRLLSSTSHSNASRRPLSSAPWRGHEHLRSVVAAAGLQPLHLPRHVPSIWRSKSVSIGPSRWRTKRPTSNFWNLSWLADRRFVLGFGG